MPLLGFGSSPETHFAHVASLTLVAGQQAEFQVGFHPKVAQIFEANMKVMVQDNQYDQTLVQLVGEGYHDIIILDNLGSKVQQDITESKTFFFFFLQNKNVLVEINNVLKNQTESYNGQIILCDFPFLFVRLI